MLWGKTNFENKCSVMIFLFPINETNFANKISNQ